MRKSPSADRSIKLNRTLTLVTLQRVALNLAWVAGTAYVLMYLVVAMLRLRYPYELEWMEGGAVDHVTRILHGQLLYVRPSLEFIPYIYTPLYYYLSALVALVTGIGFLPLRLVSLGASLGIFAVIFRWTRNENGSWKHGLIAAGLFAATYDISGSWFDIARGDSLFIFFLVSAASRLRFAQTGRGLLLSGVLLWLAFLSKQTTLFVAAPLILYSVYAYRKKSVYFLAPFVALTGLIIWVLDRIHDGWFSYYIFNLPAHHKIDPRFYAGFWTNDIIRQVPILLILAVALVTLFWTGRERNGFWFYFLLCMGGVAASWSSRLHTGGYNNVLMPVYLVLCVTAAARLGNFTGESASRKSAAARKWSWLVMTGVISQFGLLWYNPAAQVPTKWEEDAGDALIKTLGSVQGDLYMPYHGYLPSLVGKQTYAHQMAVKDVARGDPAMAQELTQKMTEAFTTRRFSLVVLDLPWESASLQRNYQNYAGMPQAALSFLPVTGYQTRPLFWYVPRTDSLR